MLDQHDQDVLLRCRRLGHEVPFGYCRRENRGEPCRLVLDCWWEQFDVRGFLRANLPPDVMNRIECARDVAPPPKICSLLDLVQRTTQGDSGGTGAPGSGQRTS